MILVFGGTTEGRQAVKTLEEAGSLYYYSTRSDGQQVELLNGVRLEGELDVPQMIALCREHGIRLLIDAAHPFAEELHRNLLFLAKHIQVPIIRYDRIYPPRTDDVVWCRDYEEAVEKLEAEGIGRLLALTGVNTIWKLRRYWLEEETADWRTPVMKHECWFRILNRRASKYLAIANRFPEERLVYYQEDETAELIERLRPDAIITKESGLSGGFCEKVATARAAGIKVFAVERPDYPPHTPNPQPVRIVTVDGPNGLRRAVEQLLPEFYPLHSGLTTGTCATAAAIAATIRLLHNETPAEVPVVLPNGETIHVPVTYGKDDASVCKEAGDDPDVTNGLEIRATVQVSPPPAFPRWQERPDASQNDPIEILGGEGVGRFTLPGFDYPPGEAAINKGPREMMRQNLRAITTVPLRVTVSIPRGREIASRTFNPRLGIEGGISVIGVSGIVKPFSEEAFIESIHKCMEVAKASGTDHVVINSGAKSERFLKARYPTLPQQAFVEYGNYIGETLRIADALHIPSITLGIMLGKAVKLAAGQLDTHSRRGTMDKDFISRLLDEAGCDADISGITLARELWTLIPAGQLDAFAQTVIRHCTEHCRPLLPNGTLTILLLDDEGHIYPE